MTATVSPGGTGIAHPPSTFRRIYGYGSIFGKAVRDSRRAILLAGGIIGLGMIFLAATIANQFATPESRKELADVIRAVPAILQGLAGKPVNVETLGGYLTYKYGTFFPLVLSLWSIIALSGTLASEARRGSLEFVASTPISRRRIALDKLLGHVTSLGIACAFIFVMTAIAGSAFAKLPGDEISVGASFSYAFWLFLMALAGGSVAFAAAPFVGRGPAAGLGGAVVFGGFILSGYQAAIPAIAPLANLTWFGWTSNYLPLAGVQDWPSLIPVAAVVVILSAIGIEAFARRDLGATANVPTPRLPNSLAGLRGPIGRASADGVPTALSWGIGLGIFGLLVAGSGKSFIEQLANVPDFVRLLKSIFPDIDIASVGGFLELLFIEFGLVLVGLAAATLVGVWASDETSGRLEFLLATPLSRRRWVVSGGLALFGLVVLVTVISSIGIAVGAVIAGSDILVPALGTIALGLYASAMVGVGVAVAGILGTRFAAGTVAALVIVTWFVDIVVPAAGLPKVFHELALTGHYGLPMLGQWDPVGIIVSLALAAGGVALGAWGMKRRDLRA